MKYKLLGVLLTVAVCAASALAAFADGPNPQPVSKPSARELARGDKKAAETDHMLRMFDRYLEGKASYEALEKVVQKYNDTWAEGAPAKDTIEKLETSDPYLGLTAVHQQRDYWCGPASAYMLLAYKGVAHYPGNPDRVLNQENLADDLDTTEDGTDLNNMPTVINNWRSSQFYVIKWAPTTGQVMDYTRSDYVYNYPVIYDAHMCSSYGYLAGWSTETWHYVTGDGYNDGSQEVHYYDPWGADGSATYGAHWIAASTVSSVLRELGMVW